MSNFVKLSRIIVVLFTLFALGSLMVLPVAYADDFNAKAFCNSKGYQYGWDYGINSNTGKRTVQCSNSPNNATSDGRFKI